jgi:hypothetical protein
VSRARRIRKVTHPAESTLDLQERIEQRTRCECGFNQGYRVDEVRLIEVPDGSAAVQRGYARKSGVGQHGKLLHAGFHLGFGTAQIAAKRDVSGH